MNWDKKEYPSIIEKSAFEASVDDLLDFTSKFDANKGNFLSPSSMVNAGSEKSSQSISSALRSKLLILLMLLEREHMNSVINLFQINLLND